MGRDGTDRRARSGCGAGLRGGQRLGGRCCCSHGRGARRQDDDGVDPPPSGGRRARRAPQAPASWRTIAKPIPEPPGADRSPRQNRSKASFRSSGVEPGAGVDTCISTWRGTLAHRAGSVMAARPVRHRKRVVDEVVDELLDRAGDRGRRRGGRELRHERDLRSSATSAHISTRSARDRDNVDRYAARFTRLSWPQHEQSRRRAGSSRDLVGRGIERGPVARRVRFEVLESQAQRGERRPELMRCVGDEPLLRVDEYRAGVAMRLNVSARCRNSGGPVPADFARQVTVARTRSVGRVGAAGAGGSGSGRAEPDDRDRRMRTPRHSSASCAHSGGRGRRVSPSGR